ncbi:putative zinc finger protein At1g68190 [Bidens hawaiensis]|uniref:putative zinc finger protein At1g68190 n=1 Tax=Bidens hawaiensis TaxID=980011 RepID=UPI00404B489F
MDRYCEYCVNLRSVVYCKADAAYLCLSCDTKVHSANPFSKRHHRTLICDICRRRAAYVRCYNHQKFMCRGCDLSQHDASSQHIKRAMSSYVGCPTARDLGALWGFDLNRFGDGSSVLDPKFGSSLCASSNTSVVGLETNVHIKEIYGGMQSVILQQLIDLLRVQTSGVDHIQSVIRCEEHKVDQNDIDQSSQQFWLGEGHPDHHEVALDSCSSPFKQLNHLESETEETDLHGDPFWKCKSRFPSGQLWSQNMQDLGVCEEPSCLDDLNMPDIDLTFKNFEELFRTEQEPTRVSQDKSMTTPVTNPESSPKKARYASQTMPFSHSRLVAESSGTSPSCGSLEHHESTTLEGKKDIQVEDSKQSQCGYRKARSDTRKRTKSQSWKFERHESVTRSF